MNNNKKLLTLLGGIFVILLVFATQPYWPKTGILKQFSQEEDLPKLTLPDQITSISILQEDQTSSIDLSLNNGVWYVDEFKADQDLVNQTISDLQNITLDQTVSTNPDNFTAYNASDSAKKITISDSNNTSYEYIIGAQAVQPNSVYLRPTDQTKVYLVYSEIGEYSQRSVDAWRDKIVAQINPENVDQIQLTQFNRTVVIEPNEQGQWVATYNGESRVVGDVARDRFFDIIDPLEGVSFATDTQVNRFNTGYGVATLVFDLKEDQGTVELIFVQDSESEQWLVKNNESDVVMTLSETVGTTLIENNFTLFN